MTLFFARVCHSGKVALPGFRLCSTRPLKLSQESQDGAGIPGPLDVPPVLFIAKYNRLIETSRFPSVLPKESSALPREENRENLELINWSPETLTQKKIKFILDAVKQTRTFEGLFERLNIGQQALFETSPKATLGNRVKDYEFKDTESVVGQKEAPCIIEKVDDVELLQWTSTKLDIRKLGTYYMMLSKFRLTLLVSGSSVAGYCLAPMEVFDPYTLLLSTVGVGFLSAAANSINQFLEVPFDSQMNRTRNRVLVRGLMTPRHVLGFAAATSIVGTSILVSYANPLAAGLGLANLVLYTCIYTPMKRISILNTWVGSVVGAMPPLIGWASATGSLTPSAFVLAGILYVWQFPHFNSLSWNLRPDYSKAGYRMMSVTDPDMCKRVALRYSVACIAICSLVAPGLGLTSMAFALDTLPLNGYLTYLSWKFYQKGDSSSSRNLFRFTLVHLPLLMTLMFISKT